MQICLLVKRKKGTLTYLRPSLPFYAMTNYTHLCRLMAWLPFQKLTLGLRAVNSLCSKCNVYILS